MYLIWRRHAWHKRPTFHKLDHKSSPFNTDRIVGKFRVSRQVSYSRQYVYGDCGDWIIKAELFQELFPCFRSFFKSFFPVFEASIPITELPADSDLWAAAVDVRSNYLEHFISRRLLEGKLSFQSCQEFQTRKRTPDLLMSSNRVVQNHENRSIVKDLTNMPGPQPVLWEITRAGNAKNDASRTRTFKILYSFISFTARRSIQDWPRSRGP